MWHKVTKIFKIFYKLPNQNWGSWKPITKEGFFEVMTGMNSCKASPLQDGWIWCKFIFKAQFLIAQTAPQTAWQWKGEWLLHRNNSLPQPSWGGTVPLLLLLYKEIWEAWNHQAVRGGMRRMSEDLSKLLQLLPQLLVLRASVYIRIEEGDEDDRGWN